MLVETTERAMAVRPQLPHSTPLRSHLLHPSPQTTERPWRCDLVPSLYPSSHPPAPPHPSCPTHTHTLKLASYPFPPLPSYPTHIHKIKRLHTPREIKSHAMGCFIHATGVLVIRRGDNWGLVRRRISYTTHTGLELGCTFIARLHSRSTQHHAYAWE